MRTFVADGSGLLRVFRATAARDGNYVLSEAPVLRLNSVLESRVGSLLYEDVGCGWCPMYSEMLAHSMLFKMMCPTGLACLYAQYDYPAHMGSYWRDEESDVVYFPRDIASLSDGSRDAGMA